MGFIGDGPDGFTAEDVLSGLADALHRPGLQQPLALRIHAMGGPSLFASLLNREQPSLRVIGLQILAALVAQTARQSGDKPCLFWSTMCC